MLTKLVLLMSLKGESKISWKFWIIDDKAEIYIASSYLLLWIINRMEKHVSRPTNFFLYQLNELTVLLVMGCMS